MNRKIFWLRLCYWVGAILDGFAAIRLTGQFVNSLQDPSGFTSVTGIAAALMWGWTALLLWADRRPAERRGVIILTLFPVLLGLAINLILPLLLNIQTFGQLGGTVLTGVGVITLFGGAAWTTRRSKFPGTTGLE